MNNGLLRLIGGVAIFSFCHSSMATLLDFTDSDQINSLSTITNGYSGTIDGIGFTLTSGNGNVNFNENYDGSAGTGCQSNGGALSCDIDGTGIDNDEITGIESGNQLLTLTFDSVVTLSGFYFLDLYVNPNESGAAEQATITLDGNFFNTVDATEFPGQGGFAYLGTAPTLAQTIEFTAAIGSDFWDDTNNDYALAGVDVSVVGVPEPSTLLLLSTAIFGLAGIKRFSK